ncbi:MAG TPA: glycosyl hydrolase family 18 protein, partial [Candidatus Limnocylindrales bacterium]|nr:glycosyl hydrolase family 18 protein [Candidatus Limnocylindrales bacterium]
SIVGQPPARPLVVLLAGLIAVLGSLPTGSARAAAPLTGDPTGPSIQYEEWLAHADDRIEFEPGGRVSVGFRPRSGDDGIVGGQPARALPAGRASGEEMAATPQGRAWAPLSEPADVIDGAAKPAPSSAPDVPTGDPGGVDQPIVDPLDVVAAEESAFVAGSTDQPLVPTAAAGLRREVFGFLPYWEVSDTSTTLEYDLLSTIAYFSVGATSSGDLIKGTSTGWSGWTSAKMTSVINAAHQAGTRVVLTVSVFAWTDSQRTTQAALLGNPSARLNLARQAAAAVRDRGADGINLDFEPIVSGYADEFTAFVREVRRELDALAPGYQLTFDTTGYIGNYPVAEATAPGGADAIFIMGYDYRGSGSSPVGSIAPLGGPAYDITDTVDAYLARVPASKLILGVPYYGRAWSTDSQTQNARNISNATYGYSSAVVYGSAVGYLATHGRRYDSVEQVAWTAYQTSTCSGSCWRQLYVDDVQALGAKYDLVNHRGLRGVGMWALGYDGTRPELYQLLYDKFVDDTTPPTVGIDTLALTQSTEGFRVDWRAYDQSPVTSYDVQVAIDGGSWMPWLSGTKATSGIYLGSEGRRFAFRARARDVEGNQSAWDVSSTGGTPTSLAVGGFARVTTTGLRMRSAPDTSAAQLGTLTAGDVLQLVGGPASADGYTWYQVRGPILDWAPVRDIAEGFWVAAVGNGATYLVPRQPPNVTVVKAGIHGLAVGGDVTATLPIVSPNGDGIDDTIAVTWTNAVALDSLTLRLYRTDGSLAGSLALSQRSPGRQTLAWDGASSSGPLPDGTYVLHLAGSAGTASYAAPASVPITADTVARYSVRVD